MIDMDIRASLLSNTAISSKVGTRVYALRLPQNTRETSIVFDVAGGFPEVQAGSLESVVKHNVTLTIYSPSYVDMRQVSDSVVEHWNGMTGAMGTTSVTAAYVQTTINTYEEEQKLYRTIVLLNIYTLSN